jgi:glyoxylase-like metal-dependent hydrolase (beta-lactamase superfamily II)
MQTHELNPYVTCLQFTIANVYLAGRPGSSWVLMDAGLPVNAGRIRQAAAERYGTNSRPEAIVLTHGHFDHTGAAPALAEAWDVPIYAHPLEAPFLSGRSAYPPKDPTVGGAMAFFGRFFPSATVNLGGRLRPLSEGVVPGMPGWTWVHTPGHTAGHVSFFHPESATLVAGDAVVTMDLDSPLAAVLKPRLSRPPAPFTYDWKAAGESVELLAGLRPMHIGAGHGTPMSGEEALGGIAALAADFPAPKRGRYARQPARFDENGIVFLPPPVPDLLPVAAAGVGMALIASWLVRRSGRRAG